MSRFGYGPFGAYGNDIVGHRRWGRGAYGNDIVGDAMHMLGLAGSGAPALSAHALAGGRGLASALSDKMQLGLAKTLPSIPLGCNSTDTPGTNITSSKVVAGATCRFTVSTSVPLRPKDYQVSPTISPFFMINDILIAMRSLKPSAAAIMATHFNPDSVRSAINFPVLWPGAPMIIEVINISNEDQFFFSVFDCQKLAGPNDLTMPDPSWVQGGYR